MILRIQSTVKPYYIQTLAMIFFPGARFTETEEETVDTIVASVISVERDGGVFAIVTLKQGEKICSAEAFFANTDNAEKTAKLAVGAAFMRAGEDFTGFTPPWGTLTGVRPAKVATELLESGLTPDEAAVRMSRDYLTSQTKAKLAVDVALAEARLITPERRRECSVYIGIPFCPSKCAYCSFVSYTSPKLLSLIPEYLTALSRDIDGIFGLIRDLQMKVASVYIGGGTPTVLDTDGLSFLLDKIRSHAPSVSEFTLEAGRPDTITREKLRIAAEHGVDRISVNTQTLNDEVLRKIGRAHSSDMFFEAYANARESGIKNINVDLIAGLPYDTAESFKKTVDGVIALSPENITVHTFSVKRASEFKAEGRFDRSGTIAAESVDYSQFALTGAGYMPYYMYRQKNTVGNLENVGYAKPGHEGLYNIYMMEEIHSIFAAGASSVTKLVSMPDAQGSVRIERFFQPKYPYEYLRLHDSDEAEKKIYEIKQAADDFFTD